MWKKTDEHELGQAVHKVLPHGKFINPSSNKPIILSLTGGEPTLRAKFIPSLLEAEEFADVKHILIETNCAVKLKREFITNISAWLATDSNRKWTWSNSPKLSVSGEKWKDAIIPEIAMMQREITTANQFDQYFKFVCGPTDTDFDEVERAMLNYWNAGIPRNIEVYIMPTACTEEQQQTTAAKVAHMCIDKGYIYCHRIQNSVFGNGVGT
jgi:organic radical activating enzyme